MRGRFCTRVIERATNIVAFRSAKERPFVERKATMDLFDPVAVAAYTDASALMEMCLLPLRKPVAPGFTTSLEMALVRMELVDKEFTDLGLSAETLDGLRQVGFERPSPIQAAFIPLAMTGQDCIGQAQTGTGKTAAFV